MTDDTAHSAPLPRLDDLLCFVVHSTEFAFNRVYRRPLQQLGLTYPQYLAMVVLWTEDALTVGQIGERLRLDSSTLTPLLKRLEALGMIRRERSGEDERRVIVRLTQAGRELSARADEVMTCMRAAIGMGSDELATLLGTLQRLRDQLDRATA